MKLVTFFDQNLLKLGIKTELGILDVSEVFTIEDVITNKSKYNSLQEYAQRQIQLENGEVSFLQEEDIQLGPCLPNPGKIICVGLNYRKHAIESKMPIPVVPILFNKFNNSIAAHNDTIQLPTQSTKVDYEAELAIVIGKKAKDITKDNALDYVFGYCNANDLSARDLQFRTNQWLLGKSCDGFCPIGPYLVTADEVPHPNELQIQCIVNGEVRQNSSTSDMIFHCDEIISFVSQYMTLEPGDIILTGTPEGVVMGYPEHQQQWLKQGDTVSIKIENLGTLTNVMQ